MLEDGINEEKLILIHHLLRFYLGKGGKKVSGNTCDVGGFQTRKLVDIPQVEI